MEIAVNRCFVIIILLVLLAGIPVILASEIKESPEIFYKQAKEAMENSHYELAYYLFMNASEGYGLADNIEMKRDSFLQAKRIVWMFAEMPLNKTGADETIAAAYPNFTPEERQVFLEPGKSIQFASDGQTAYYEGIARNIMFHNMTMMRDTLKAGGESPFFDQISPYIQNLSDENNPLNKNHTFLAHGEMNIPRDRLPENGTLQVWLPLPVETDGQSNISIVSVEPAEYIVSAPVTTGDIGEVYLEIPLEEMNDEYVNISEQILVTTSLRSPQVNPGTIGEYDTDSELFQKYTRSQQDITVTPEVIELAQEIVGDETNPYKKAQLLYDYILNTLPYSNIPHTYLAARNISESDFVFDTGFGDCGTQSAYFSALCRAVGIPARAPGGYQMVPGHEGTHFWAEFYIPKYGWIPVDVTVAEAGDWAYNATQKEREEFKKFYFGNLDPYRFTIQTDLDEFFSGEPNPEIIFTIVHQNPAVICLTSDEDAEMIGMEFWSYTFEDLGKE